MAVPDGPNQRWSLDFASDTLADGRRFRILCVEGAQVRRTRPASAAGQQRLPQPARERSAEA